MMYSWRGMYGDTLPVSSLAQPPPKYGIAILYDWVFKGELVAKLYYTSRSDQASHLLPNRWDLLALLCFMAIMVALAMAARQMSTPYELGEMLPISLDPSYLPHYGIRTITRMAIAMALSLIFTLIVGTLAAKNKRAEQLILPIIDVLQSVPVLSFLSITLVGFIALFPNNLLGPECACIFAIFTSQAWNITLGFYQTLKTIPHELKEAAAMFHLSKWQRFWRIDVPCCMPSLLWNVMISMSASWFFVVAAEAIFVANQEIRLPGIGSYIATAIEQSNLQAVGYAIITMLIIILLYDQLCFRPLMYWSEKFNFDHNEEAQNSWVMDIFQRTRLFRYCVNGFSMLTGYFINHRIFKRSWGHLPNLSYTKRYTWLSPALWYTSLTILVGYSGYTLWHYLIHAIEMSDVFWTLWLGGITCLRVMILIIISSLIWVPIGVWIGMHPKIAYRIQPLIQFVASFPANLFFPVVVMLIVSWQLNTEIWITPLMILGSQWYILFNVIAGTMAMPKDLYHAVNNFGVHGWQWWKRFMLPGIFPYYITGAITAAGGAWNASIVAEWVTWGETTLIATGLGAYIAQQTSIGDFHRIALGTAVMCGYVLVLNWILWQPLYRLAERKFQLAG